MQSLVAKPVVRPRYGGIRISFTLITKKLKMYKSTIITSTVFAAFRIHNTYNHCQNKKNGMQ